MESDGTYSLRCQNDKYFLQVPEIDDRSDITGLRQIVGIIVQLADVSDQDARQELLTDVGRHDFVTDMDLVVSSRSV